MNTPAMAVGEKFSLTVAVRASAAAPVDMAQVYLDFDAARLQALAITGGTALEEMLQASADNSAGRIDYAAGTLGTAKDAAFTLMTVEFQGVAAGGTTIAFAPLTAPRQTKAIWNGVNITGTLTTITVVIQ